MAPRLPAMRSTQRGHATRNRSEESRGVQGNGEGSSRGNAYDHGRGPVPEAAQAAAPANIKAAGPPALRTKRGVTEPDFLKNEKETFPGLGQNNADANPTAHNLPSFLAASASKRGAKTHIGPWELGKTVGVGGTCKVRLVRHARTGDIAVAKIIEKSTADRVRARSLANLTKNLETPEAKKLHSKMLPVALEREIVIMRLLRHPNIVRLYDVWENKDEIYLIMENVDGGELFDFLAERGALPEREAVYLFRQLVEALMYCHRMQIFHRDLKPENILLNKDDYTVKLIDFGMAAYQPNGGLLNTPCGSPHYAAPELLRGNRYDGSKADVWSAAVVLFVMLTAEPPFNYPKDIPENQKLKFLYEHIIRADVRLPDLLSKEARHLFRQVFVADPNKRIGIIELWEHPFMHKYDHTFGYEGRGIESWIGPSPALDNWNLIAGDSVDPEIFRNLRTLWHDVDEDVLAEKLMNKE
jgi:serine/threonine-protein kinase HSL1 (negative regulator of Swe1 kinase)